MEIIKVDRAELINVVKTKLVEADTVLDIGCGIRPQNYIKPKVHICCDPHLEYLDHIKKTVEYYRCNAQVDFAPNEYCTITKENKSEFVFINTDWEHALELFPELSIDTIFLLDVIEHLDKGKGLRLIQATEKICRKQIVLFTPLGFIEQEHETKKDAWGFSGAHLQKHLSGWLPEDFGEEWEIFVCEDFHVHDNIGAEYEEPKGAFFAVKAIQNNFAKNIDEDKIEVSNAYSELGEFILNRNEDVDKIRAQKLFEKAIELNPFNASAFNNLGVIFWEADQFEKAVECFEKSFEIDGDSEVYLNNLIDVYNYLGEEKKAAEVQNKFMNRLAAINSGLNNEMNILREN